MSIRNKSLSYAESGVNIDKGNELVKKISPYAKSTKRNGVLDGIGGFGALFELPTERFKKPVLVSGTDGVGTKLKLAFDMKKHDTIGIDLVAMCANDILVSGAEPLFFLDYYATGQLSVEDAESVIQGIAKGCSDSGCSLVGGETAEMPGMYSEGEYDLAGFCVGIVEKDNIITGKDIKANDGLIAISSSGAHSNGYSLIRKILEVNKIKLTDKYDEEYTVGEVLLKPTRLYTKSIIQLISKVKIKGLSHITGGGLTENIPRILPENLEAEINLSSWKLPKLFTWLKKLGNVPNDEMLKTFNCGVGMIICVDNNDVNLTLSILKNLGENAWEIGKIKNSKNNLPQVKYTEL